MDKNSIYGKASFIISIIVFVSIFILFLIAGYLELTIPGGLSENYLQALMVGLFLFFCIGLLFVSLGLGIAGLFQNDFKKALSILGIVFSGTIGIIIFLIILIGLLI